MKTQIFKSYYDFLKRENDKINGVSEKFAKENPTWEAMNETNEACRDCRDCSDCSDCSSCSYCFDCSSCSSCSYCRGCRDCRDCSYCLDCRDCSSCSDCSDCSDCSSCSDNNKTNSPAFVVPIVKNIHQEILKACSKDGALEMDSWHKCETTHCRAGWAVALAGEEGKQLEKQTSTLFAALQIFKKSSPLIPHMTAFFETNEKAMEDIKKFAEEEKSL